MEHQAKKPSIRTFRPASVGICHSQTATDRFGDEAKGAIRDRERASMGIHPEGSEAPFTWPGLESDVEHGAGNSIYRLVPSIQAYRNNLTALSQTHNLYFVAYQGRIFVYVPRSVPKQTIPRHPDLQLVSKPSKAALFIGGCVDPVSPHTINHIITGVLGEEEIVVACFDDGDVIAYYVKYIAGSVFGERNAPRAAQHSPKRARLDNTPRLFFHENVGHSTWGLAVHSKSRLIAVSSNRYEVTVFAFALATCQKEPREASDPCECCRRCDNNTDSGIPGRARNWRIVVALGPHATNIPNVCFVDDEDGQAEKVCAVDIKGSMWLADIWKMFQPVTRMVPYAHPMLQSEEFWPASSRGWGVLALAEESFMMVDTVEEMLGVSEKSLDIVQPGSGCPQPMVNVSQCVKAIPDNPCLPPPIRARIVAGALVTGTPEDEPSDESEVESEDSGEQSEEADEEMEQGSEGEEDTDDIVTTLDVHEGIAANQSGAVVLFPPLEAGIFQQALQDLDEALGQLAYAVQEFQEATSVSDTPVTALVQSHEVLDSVTSKDDERSAFSGQSHNYSTSRSPPIRLDMAFFPHNGRIQAIPRRTTQLVGFLKRPLEFNHNRPGATEQRIKQIAKRYRFLRTYEKDLELRSFRGENEKGLKEMGVLCPQVVTLGTFHDRNVRPHFRATSRLNMLAHIPELSLVIVGSPTGRVLLLTPTKLRSQMEKRAVVWDHGLRVEWILPRESDERRHRTTIRPLHGMAIGPVQDDVQHTGGDAASRAAAPRRFRFMLHYRNHDILTYEITREEQTGKLCIF